MNYPPYSGYNAQAGYGSQPPYNPQAGYNPQPPYNPQGGYGPQPPYNTQGGYDPQPPYNAQGGYSPQSLYNAQGEFENQSRYNNTNRSNRDKSSLFHRHPLVFRYRTAWNCGKDNYLCDICKNRYNNQPSYYCEECDFDVCPSCYERR